MRKRLHVHHCLLISQTIYQHNFTFNLVTIITMATLSNYLPTKSKKKMFEKGGDQTYSPSTSSVPIMCVLVSNNSN